MNIDSFLGPLGLFFSALSAIMWKGLEGPTKFLRSETESMGMIGAVFGGSWGMAEYLAVCLFFAVISVAALGKAGLVEHLPRAYIAALLTSTLGGTVLWTAHHELTSVIPAAIRSIQPAETLTPENIAQPFFSPTEDGLTGFGLYAIYWLITFALMLMKGIAWAGREFVLGLVILAIALWGAGDYGRRFFRWAIMCYLCCVLLLDLVVSLSITGSYRVTKNLTKEQNAIMANISTVLFVILVFWAVLWAYQNISTSSVGGWLRSTVKGHTKSDIQNEPNVKTRDQELTVTATVDPVHISDQAIQAPSQGASEDPGIKVTDHSAQSGDLVIGRSRPSAQPPVEDPAETVRRYISEDRDRVRS